MHLTLCSGIDGFGLASEWVGILSWRFSCQSYFLLFIIFLIFRMVIGIAISVMSILSFLMSIIYLLCFFGGNRHFYTS